MPMMIPDKKKIASIIIGKIKPKMNGEEEYSESERPEFDGMKDIDMALEASMESFLQAMEQKNAAAMAQAFKDAFDLIESQEETMEESQDIEL